MDHETMVERAVELDAPADVVWSALTDDDAISDWYGGRATLDPVPGGSGRFETDGGEVRRARVDEVEPGRRLSWRWWIDGDDEAITAVTFELIEVPAGTRLVVAAALLLGAGVGRRAGSLPRACARCVPACESGPARADCSRV
jgi:uncharacterized protein YndB with AHSA1/START domain